MKKHGIKSIIAAMLGVVSITTAYAMEPVWTYSAPNPSSLSVTPQQIATVTYTITNNSSFSKQLELVTSITDHPEYPPTPGITSSGCYLPATTGGVVGTCTLTINVDGSQIPPTGIHSGPYLCEAGSPHQCYQPSPPNLLNISFATALLTVTPSGDGNETISPSTPQTVHFGATQQFTLTPNTGYTVSHNVGGNCPVGSWSGSIYTTGPITSSCSVSFSATINKYTVSATGDTNVIPKPASQMVNYLQQGTIVLSVAAGYNPTIVEDNCGGTLSGNTYTTGPVTSNCLVRFGSALKQFTVSPSGDIHLTINPSTPQTVNFGSFQSFIVTASPGYTVSQTVNGTCPLGNWSGSTYTTGAITFSCTVIFSSILITTYTNIYANTVNNLGTYTPNLGVNWGYMLSPQVLGSPFPSVVAVTSDGTIYQSTYISGNGNPGNGAATLIYSQDGLHWNQVATTIPSADNMDKVLSIYAVGNTVYVGTSEGYVYSTSNQGTTWLPSTPAQVPDASAVNAIVVDASGNYYAGTDAGTIYYSTNSGQSWTALINQPSGGGISSLGIDSNGTLYVVTFDTTTQPLYNTNPLGSGTWVNMGAIPGLYGDAYVITASGTTVYVGTANSYVLSTTDLGSSWSGSQIPNDSSGIISLFVNNSLSLSQAFVEAYGIIQINGSTSMGSITVTNFSSSTATNVQAKASQLPTGVVSSSCASVASGSTCVLTLTASGTANPFAPTAFDIINSNNNVISRAAVVSSVSPDAGADYYYVYAVAGGIAYVLDNNVAAGSPVIWSSNGTQYSVDNTPIWGIAESSTATVPYPDNSVGASQYDGQQNCFGATDGSCNSSNIFIYYNYDIGTAPVNTNYYATGLCYQNTTGGANPGDWYLPATCELNGAIYLNTLSNNFGSCSPILTSFSTLVSLGALGGDLGTVIPLDNSYYSSTEYSQDSAEKVWAQYFHSGGGTKPFKYSKGTPGANVICSRKVTF